MITQKGFVHMSAKMGGQSGFKRFLRENRTIAFSIPVLLVLLIVLIIVYSGLGKDVSEEAVPAVAEASGTLSSNPQTIEILPNTERVIKNGSDTDDTAVQRDPFSGPMNLVGIVASTDGKNIAVIEANDKSYILEKGDNIESNMTVSDITADKVVIKNTDTEKEITLKLEKRNNSQSVIK